MTDDAFAEVKAKVDLVKVVGEHLRLTKRNKDFIGLCPFHQEDTPSFTVHPQTQTWYCFGCQRHGDVFTFVELIEKTDKRGSLQMLAERAGVELKKLSPEQRERSDSRKRLLAMLKLAAQYYEYVLWSTPAGEPGRRLLADRAVGEETSRRFQLGYAPAGRGFADYLRAKKRSLADAQEAGLMRRDGSDFFSQRLVIPIRDERGQPLAFTARTVSADEPRKYINSPETPAYVKGRVIFGLDLARDEIMKRGHAVLMEGQFDVITAHQFGVQNAVASSGTALTDEQVRLLQRFTDELLLVFDADRAGRSAAFKAIELAAAHQMRTRVATVTGAKDPDEFLRAAGDEASKRWEELVENAPSGWEYWIKDALTGLNTGNPNHLELAASRAREVLERIPDPAVRDTYRERAAGWIGVQPHLLQPRPPQEGGSGSDHRSDPYRRLRARAAASSNGLEKLGVGKKVTVGRYLLMLLAVRPVAFERVRTKITPEELDEEDRGVYVRMLETYERGGASGLESELAGYPAEEQDLIRRAWAAPPPSVDDELAVELAQRIRLDHMKNRESAIIRELSDAERERDMGRVVRLETEAKEIARAISDLERRV
jgi:DNA primase